MKVFFTLLLAGVLVLMLEGALATILPPPWCPDLRLLAVICIGLRWQGLAPGLALAYFLGSSADVLSGSLMGLHALLSMLAFVSAVFAGRQLNLKGLFPLMAFSASVSLFYGLALYAVSIFFVSGIEFVPQWLWENLLHSLVNGLFAPLVFEIFTRLAVWAGADDSSERALFLETSRGPM
jgi:rod shape-determining protein MreD